ncbi:MAG: TRAP transporter large permease [Pikeienuella sp.]|uniref:TRAP transporter large permease n=1 Tax=Pikeienuella sp. TaxID=2831957 RepID=UPI00391BEB18
MGLALILLFGAAAILAGAAVAYVAGASAVLAFVATDHARFLAIMPQRIFSQLDVFTFLAMPLFILAGEIMTRGGVTARMIDLALLAVGRLKGGLGHVNIAASVFMAGVSGSAVADAAATTNTLVPAMTARRYPLDYAAALTAASCVIGPIIPPSIVMIFYGALMNVSVAALFAGGILPGLLIAALLALWNLRVAHRDDHPGGEGAEPPPLWPTIARALPALSIPATIVAGIVFGVVTPTEAAALAVLIAGALVLAYRLADGEGAGAAFRGAMEVGSVALERAVILTGSIFMILVAAAVFGYLFGILGAPEAIAALVARVELTGTAYLLLAAAVLFVAGMFIDVTMALVLLVPLLIPAATATGLDPVHVGIVACIVLTLGLISPPFGGCLMVISAASGVNYARLCRAVTPFLGVHLVAVVILILFPAITLTLPRLAGLSP